MILHYSTARSSTTFLPPPRLAGWGPDTDKPSIDKPIAKKVTLSDYSPASRSSPDQTTTFWDQAPTTWSVRIRFHGFPHSAFWHSGVLTSLPYRSTTLHLAPSFAPLRLCVRILFRSAPFSPHDSPCCVQQTLDLTVPPVCPYSGVFIRPDLARCRGTLAMPGAGNYDRGYAPIAPDGKIGTVPVAFKCEFSDRSVQASSVRDVRLGWSAACARDICRVGKLVSCT